MHGVLDVAQRQRVFNVPHHDQPDHFRRRAQTALSDIGRGVSALIGAGARNIVYYGGSPADGGGVNEGGGTLASTYTQDVSAGLAATLASFARPGVRIRILDFEAVYLKAAADPGCYGFATGAECVAGASCVPRRWPCRTSGSSTMCIRPRRASIREQSDGSLYYNHVIKEGEGPALGPRNAPPSEGGVGGPGGEASSDNMRSQGEQINMEAEPVPLPLFGGCSKTSASPTRLLPRYIAALITSDDGLADQADIVGAADGQFNTVLLRQLDAEKGDTASGFADGAAPPNYLAMFVKAGHAQNDQNDWAALGGAADGYTDDHDSLDV